jgi:hypothetical protein
VNSNGSETVEPFRSVVKCLLVGAIMTGANALHAQQADVRVHAGLDLILDYPGSLRPDCDSGFGVAPSLRVGRSLGPRWLAEVGVAVPVALSTGDGDALDGGCGGAIPGTTWRDFPRGSPSVVPEFRVVFEPMQVAGESVRVTAGSGWYAGRSTAGVLAGVGYAWDRAILDVEHWQVSVPYDRVGTPVPGGDPITGESGREWTGLWQLRFGLKVWPR